ncbi:MAG: hypothetical protein ACRC46_01785 [Thermoguttaceae bacterium]
MPTLDVTLSLPAPILATAKERGLLEPEAIASLIREAVTRNAPSVRPGLRDFIDPAIYGRMKIRGDIIAPIDDVWMPCTY